jgi:RNA polymerase sigma factor (sigma-70 family)
MPSPSVALLRTQSDERLVALAAGGHERAFEAIVDRYRRPLLRHARRYLPETRAEDAMQQALLSAWTALRRGDDVRELRPWLHRIVHNSALNARRAAGYDYDELRETLEGSGGPAELAERRAVVRGTLAGLAALPERQRDALLRIAVEGRSQDEVAEQLGLSQGAVRQLVHRARTALRAAATIVVPLPLATWLATAGAGRGDVAVRVGELVAGAGGSATLAKAGAVAVLAGGAVAGPAVMHDVSDREQQPRAAASSRSDAGRDGGDADVAPAVVPASLLAPSGSGPSDRGVERSGTGGASSGSRRDAEDSSGSAHGDGSGSGHRDHQQSDDHGSSGSRRDDDDDTSDSHGGDDDTRGSGHDDGYRDDPSGTSHEDDPQSGTWPGEDGSSDSGTYRSRRDESGAADLAAGGGDGSSSSGSDDSSSGAQSPSGDRAEPDGSGDASGSFGDGP